MLPSDEKTNMETERQARVAVALRNSGLASLNTHVREFDTYGSDLYTLSDLNRSTAHAMDYLAANGQTSWGPGPALINVKYLSAGFVAMGNLIREFARASGRAYSGQEDADWKLVLTYLWDVLKARDGKRYDALFLPAKLRDTVKKKLSTFYSDVESTSFFFRHASPSAPDYCYDDLDFMLNYLTLNCRLAFEIETERRREVSGRRRQPTGESKLSRRCAVM